METQSVMLVFFDFPHTCIIIVIIVIAMDLITIYRHQTIDVVFYWCLIEFTETGDTVSHVGIFDPAL
jgi:hypothetical protein